MTRLLAALALIFRVCRPTRGLHALPRESRTVVPRETRFSHVPAVADVPGVADRGRVRPYATQMPAATLAPAPAAVCQPSPVRPYVLAHEASQARARADMSRLGVAVLVDIANAVEVQA